MCIRDRGYGDWIYVGTCYAAIGNTLSLMKSSLGDEFDDKVLKATFDALYNLSLIHISSLTAARTVVPEPAKGSKI